MTQEAMLESLNIFMKLTPEMIELLERRYNILRTISHCQPIGRRMLAEKLGLGERIVRSELDFLRENQFLRTDAAGVSLDGECESLLSQIGALVHKMRGLNALEKYLTIELGLDKVYIVPGNIDEDAGVLKDLGRLAGRYIHEVIQPDWIISVTGGSTMAEAARSVPKAGSKNRILVVPGRGGLGEDVEVQANTIAAAMAQRLGASYRLLHVPDNISEEAMESLIAEPRVQEVLSLNKKANLLLHGIGVPKDMAYRRDMSWDKLLDNTEKLPVGEAFGNYFAADGTVVYITPTVGPKLEDLARISPVAAVAGGRRKGEAILAVLKGGFINVLITDQGAAEVIRDRLTADD